LKQYASCDVDVSEDTPCVSSAFHIGQQFYSPDDISSAELIPKDRPYAGWLCVGGTWRAASTTKAFVTDVYLGATGKASLAKQFQTKWHRIVTATTPRGWEHQIDTRLGLIVAHSRHWIVYDPKPGGHRVLEISPFVGGNLGNIVTDGYVGGRVKVGWNITRDWTHSAIGPTNYLVAALADPASGPAGTDAEPTPAALGGQRAADPAQEPKFEIFLSLDGRARVIGYNAFPDAADRHGITRRKVGADIGVGTGVRVGSFMVTYRVARISKEYSEALSDHHQFKALRFLYGGQVIDSCQALERDIA
jgi:hypothetical protein